MVDFQLREMLLSPNLLLQLRNFLTYGRDIPSHMTENFEASWVVIAVWGSYGLRWQINLMGAHTFLFDFFISIFSKVNSDL